MVKLIVRFASEQDRDAIDRLRDEYFRERALKEYPAHAGVWLVCVDPDGSVCGCLGYDVQHDALCITDIYAEIASASWALLNHIHDAADLCQIPIVGVTHSQIIVDYAIKRGWQVAGTALVRRPSKREEF